MSETPRRRSLWGLMLLAVVSSAVLAGLGTWQVQRLGWKTALIAERETLMAAEPLVITDIAASVPGWRTVRVGGEFLNDKSLLVGPHSWHSLPHWRLVTPLRLPTGGFVLVDRGWVPDQGKRAAFRGAARPAGQVTVEGIARLPTATGYFSPPNLPEKDSWFRVAPEAMGVRLALANVAPFWVVAQGRNADGGYPVPDVQIPMPPNNHLQYAITWYGLALAALVIAGVYWRRERRPTS